jgi:hypothetical protein
MSDKKRVKIFMGVGSTGDRWDAQCYALREIEERYKEYVELVYPAQCVYRSFHDYMRCAMVDEFLETDCDMIWFLDSDICPPKHILDLVAVHGDKWKAAGAAYPLWMAFPGSTEPSIIFTAYKGIIDNAECKGIHMAEVPRTGTEFLDALATGCLFLKREVFEKLEKPYFEFKFDAKTRRMVEGEDLGFALKLSRLGIKFFTDYGMVCKHYKRVCLLDINNYATELSNHRILAYDKEIRPQVEQAIKQAMEFAYKQGLDDGKKNVKGRNFTFSTDGDLQTSSGLILPGSSLAQM